MWKFYELLLRGSCKSWRANRSVSICSAVQGTAEPGAGGSGARSRLRRKSSSGIPRRFRALTRHPLSCDGQVVTRSHLFQTTRSGGADSGGMGVTGRESN